MNDRLELEQLERRISELGAIEHSEILKMMPVNQVSTNENGSFCDLGKLDPAVLANITHFVEYSAANNERLAEYDKSVHTTAMLLHRPRTRDVPKCLPPFMSDPPARRALAVANPKSTAKMAFMKRSGDVVERCVPMDLVREETEPMHFPREDSAPFFQDQGHELQRQHSVHELGMPA